MYTPATRLLEPTSLQKRQNLLELRHLLVYFCVENRRKGGNMVVLPPNFDLRQTILMDGSFGPQDMEHLAYALSTDMTQIDMLRTPLMNWKQRKSPAN